MQNFSQIGEVPWPRLCNIVRILRSMTLNLYHPGTRGAALKAGIRNPESGIRKTEPESGIQKPESGIRKPESKRNFKIQQLDCTTIVWK